MNQKWSEYIEEREHLKALKPKADEVLAIATAVYDEAVKLGAKHASDEFYDIWPPIVWDDVSDMKAISGTGYIEYNELLDKDVFLYVSIAETDGFMIFPNDEMYAVYGTDDGITVFRCERGYIELMARATQNRDGYEEQQGAFCPDNENWATVELHATFKGE